MTRVLTMTFLTEEGKKVSVRVSNVKETLTGQEVKTAMETIIAKNIFTSKSGDFKSIDSANMEESSTTELEVK
ncbi:DUF2922 domain-containing protein [Clostridium sp.]|jgi:hypothetical protein|uniref:DUF2922 domain-containing protein n=1 Tax=Clostridium sp. TaxID=1506 RepID=UPI002FDCC11D